MSRPVASPPRIEVIDTHTGGEPTRVVVAGGPDLGSAPLAARRELFREKFDTFRSAVVNEPRGSDVMVGALVVPPADEACAAGVIFFNNVGYLGMCGHGTIGVVVALGHAGLLAAGIHRLDTPVGSVTVEYDGANRVAFENVPSYRHAAGVGVEVDGVGRVHGDVAWGGNWFFLVHDHQERLDLANVERLTDVTWRIRQALGNQGITGETGAEIDHIELFGPPHTPTADSRSFVLCPGKAYDRSPCGTGTSAKLACLYADGALAEGQVWRQESIVGSVFEGTVRVDGGQGQVIPRITGTAYVTGEATLILDPSDPFQMGIRQL
jgi:4-hydroxyproline epimerase